MFKDIKDEIPILFEITLNYGTQKGMCFNVNSEDYTAYTKESEILLDDGFGLKVTNIHQQNTHEGKPFLTVQLDQTNQSKRSKV